MKQLYNGDEAHNHRHEQLVTDNGQHLVCPVCTLQWIDISLQLPITLVQMAWQRAVQTLEIGLKITEGSLQSHLAHFLLNYQTTPFSITASKLMFDGRP